MLQYTQATLHTALTLWNTNSDPDFAATLPEIVRRGEIRLSRALDLDALDTVNTAVSTAAATATVTKPATLIDEGSVSVTVSGAKSALIKRSRDWIELYNRTSSIQGTPKYYCDTNETTWTLAPVPAGVYPLTIQGNFLLTSIEDGSSSAVTWFSTQAPDLLYHACSIEALDFLKAWARKDREVQEFGQGVALFTGIARNLQRTDYEDTANNRQSANTPGTQG